MGSLATANSHPTNNGKLSMKFTRTGLTV
jgi:hypothetical protein